MFWIAGSVVVAFGLWLIGLAAFILVAPAPARAGRFLMGFASSARAHYAEQGLRLIVGTAIAIFAPMMMFPALFRVFGWLIVLSALGLLLLPWRWHRRFARWVRGHSSERTKLHAKGCRLRGVGEPKPC